MTELGLPGRYLFSDPKQWPQHLSLQEEPFPLGLYGQSDPVSYEDTMFLFDQVCRLHPLGIHFFMTGSSQPDLFFYHYLARYLEVPCHIFEIFFHQGPPLLKEKSPHPTVSPPHTKAEKFAHFCLYLEKKQAPPQEQVKQWIRELYLP